MALTVTVTDRVAHLGPVQQAVQGLGDTAIGQLVLDGKKFDTRFDGSVIADGPMTRSIDTASSLAFTVSDPERYLLQGKYFERRADLLFDDLWFRMCAMDKNGDQFTMTFQDREVALLARHKKARRASRAKVTRAEFLRSLVREEPHISFVCPELHTRQRIASVSKADQVTQQKAADSQRKRGIAAREKIKIAHVGATAAQIEQINICMNVAVSQNANELATMAMLVAAIGESGFKPSATDYATHTHKGVFQSNQIPQYDTKAQATAFLTGGRSFKAGGAIGAAAAHPDWSPGTIATYVEISNGAASYYDGFVNEAKAIYKKFGGLGKVQDSDTGGGTYFQKYEYSRGEPGGQKGEDTWTCGQRLADEVGWRWFCVAGVVYFISDYDLIRSRPRMTLNENSPGVDNIDFSLDDSAKIPDTVTISGRATRWAAPPGTVVNLDESMADAAGAWIVTEIERPSLSNNDVTITLTKPKSPHLEPAPQVAIRAATSTTTADGGSNAGDVNAKRGYPLAKQGTLIGTPGVGTHSFSAAPNNWESDNAVDIGIPTGTPVIAVDDGTIGPSIGFLPGSGQGDTSRFAGQRLHLITADNEYYYAHLSTISVNAGDKVKRGAQLGKSGSANGVEHLHFASKKGNPETLIGERLRARPT